MKLRNGLKVLLATVVISVTSSASAAFITTDWKAEGDRMVMTDEETGIEWLKLPQTFGLSVGEVRNNAYFDGWDIAQRDEVYSLVQRARAGDYTQFNTTVTESNYLASYAIYDFGDGTYKMAGIATNGVSYAQYGTFTENYSREDFGVWLKSDGGLTYSSINDPSWYGCVQEKA